MCLTVSDLEMSAACHLLTLLLSLSLSLLEILAQVEERFVTSSPVSSCQSPYVPRRMVCIFPAATAEIEQEEDQKEENPTQNIASADITIETECSLEDTIDSLYLRIKVS